MTNQIYLTAGVKHVYEVVGSKNATTHSFMVMPTCNAEGDLLDTLYLLTPEPGGFILKLFLLFYSYFAFR